MSAKFENDSPIYGEIIIHLLYTRTINRLQKFLNADRLLIVFILARNVNTDTKSFH